MKNLNTCQSNTQINIIKNILILAVILIIIPIGGCDQEQNKVLEQGFLRGNISIGPLCPVETIPPNPNCQPTEATYKAWPIAIWTIDKKTKVGQLEPNLDGSYSFELPEGTYLIDLEIQHLFDTTLPETVIIGPNETAILDIYIDTGIR